MDRTMDSLAGGTTEHQIASAREGDRWLAGEAGLPVLCRHHDCGQISHVELSCSQCHQPMGVADIDVLPGPGAAA
jgi:hypothetical protein